LGTLLGKEVGVLGEVVSEVGTLILVPAFGRELLAPESVGLLLELGVVVVPGVWFICESPPAGIPVDGVVVVAFVLAGFFLLVAVGFLVFFAFGLVMELGVVVAGVVVEGLVVVGVL
jgi:hypothetical protein